jgi:hypothetical protein
VVNDLDLKQVIVPVATATVRCAILQLSTSSCPLPIEEAVGRDNHFTVRESGKLGHNPSGIWKPPEPCQSLFRSFAQAKRGCWIVALDVPHRRQELLTTRRCEANSHDWEP